MRVIQAYRFALDPAPAQERLLASHAGAARFAWNWGLARCQERYQAEGRWYSAAGLHKLWNAAKKADPALAWWSANSKCAYQESFRDLDRALAAFIASKKGLRRGRRAGFPKFKKRGKCRDSFRFGAGVLRCSAATVTLPRLGTIGTHESTRKLARRLEAGTARILSATVIVPGSAEVQASFAPVAKHYGAVVVPCPPRRGNRKGAVECGVKFCCGRWWRTMTATTPEEAQVSLDRFWATTGDARLRPPGRYADPGQLTGAERPAWPTVGELADAETLIALPAVPYPATIEVTRAADDRASVAFRGNRYSVTPGLGGTELTLRHRLGTGTVEIFTPGGTLMVTHRLAPPGAGSVVRTPAHRAALEAVVLSQFSAARPCDRKANRPPGQAALTERAALMGPQGLEPAVDLAQLAEVIRLAFPPATAVPGARVTA